MENFEEVDGRPPDEGLFDPRFLVDFSNSEASGLDGGEKKESGVFDESWAVAVKDQQPLPPHEFGDASTDVDILAYDGDSQLFQSGAPQTQQLADALTADGENESEEGEHILGDMMPVSENEEEEKEPLSYELQQGYRILRELMSDSHKNNNWPFMDPVDSEDLAVSDYYERIKEPMWLKRILCKFDDRVYTNITEFARDFRLMLENCYRYNGPDHQISKRGIKMETVFEQKLLLLSRELRVKTSRAATSGNPIKEQMITGTRRRKVPTPHDSSDLLNQLRQEEKDREREQRRQQVEERRQQQLAFAQDLIDWDDKLLGPGGRDRLEAMWELPQIGHFLFLCASVMNLGEVMQWELERSFWMPRQSSTMHLVMTSLLSTPYQRTRLDTKPPMPYNIWEDKLRTRVRHWYKIFNEQQRDTKKTHRKLGLDERFFKILGVTNPLEKRKFHELTYYQRIWIGKGLCDWCLETQESVREAFESLPLEESREYALGYDADGNKYIHFPQFCGQDLRVYRVAPIEMPKTGRPKVPKYKEKTVSPPKKKKRKSGTSSPAPQKSRSARLRQSARQNSKSPCPSEHDDNSASDSGISESEGSVCRKSPRSRQTPRRTRTPSPSPSPTPTKQPPPPKVGRSSRNSAAARDWMPRDSTAFSSVASGRGTRSQRLTCAPELLLASGSSTPTTNATPSGSRSSTPVTKDRSSRSSTPSLETSSRSSSPRKAPARKGKAGRRGRGRGRGRGRKSRYKPVSDEDMETEEQEEQEASRFVKKENDDSTSIPDEESILSGSNPDKDITPAASDSALVSKTSLAELERSESSNILENGLPREDVSRTTLQPFSSYKTEVDEKASCMSDPSDKDSKTDCDTETKPVLDQGQSKLPDTNPAHGADTSKSETVENCILENRNMTDAQSRDSQTGDIVCQDAKDLGASLHRSGHVGSVFNNELQIKSEPETDIPKDSKLASEIFDDVQTNQDCKGSVVSPTNELSGAKECVGSTAVKTEPSDPAGKESDIKAEPMDTSDSASDAAKHVKEEFENSSVGPDRVGAKGTKPEHMGVIKTEPGDDGIREEKAVEGGTEVQTEIKQEPEEEIEVAPEIEHPDIGPFMLVADSVEKLRHLSLQFAEPEPIIEIKGKKEKILRPPPRKKCVSELYERLCYLLTELEPWETKLTAANRKARIKIRKEFESFVEEFELAEKEVEDVWESEEEQTEEEEEDDEDEEEESEEEKAPAKEEVEEKKTIIVKEEPELESPAPVATPKPKNAKKTAPQSAAVANTQGIVASATPSDNPEKSMFGRVRKRKVIPNSYDEPPVTKKKKGKDGEGSSQVTTPNILQSSRNKNAVAASSPLNSLQSVLSKATPITAPTTLPAGMQLLNINGQTVLLNTNSNPPVILQTSAPLSMNNLNLLAQLSAKAASGNNLSTKVAASGTNNQPSPVTKVVVSGVNNQPSPMTKVVSPMNNQPSPVTKVVSPMNNQPSPATKVAVSGTNNQSSPVTTVVVSQTNNQPSPVTTVVVSGTNNQPAPVTKVVSGTNSQPSSTKIITSTPVTKTQTSTQVPQQVIRTLLAATNAPQHPKATPTALQRPPKTPKPLQPPAQKLSIIKAPIATPSLSSTESFLVPKSEEPSTFAVVKTEEELTGSPVSPPASEAAMTVDPGRRMERLQYYNMERLQYYKFNDVNQMKATIRQQLSRPMKLKAPVMTSPQSTNTALSNLIQAGLLPQSSGQAEMKPLLPESAASTASPPSAPREAQLLSVPSIMSGVSPESAIGLTLSSGEPLTQVAHQQIQSAFSPVKVESEGSVSSNPGSISMQALPSTPPPQIAASAPHVLKLLTAAPNPAVSPTNITSPTTGSDSLSTSPTPGSDIAQGQGLPPEVRDALKLSEFHLGKLMNTSPGLVRALSSLSNTGHGTRPKYANNVTVKSLLESRALRQKAQQGPETELAKEPLSCVRVISPLKNSPDGATAEVPVQQGAEQMSYVRVISPQKNQTNVQAIPSVTQTSPVKTKLMMPVKSPAKRKINLQPGPSNVVRPQVVATAKPVGDATKGTLNKIPLQLQAIRTSQGTILRMPSGQQITVRANPQRLPTTTKATEDNTQVAFQMTTPGLRIAAPGTLDPQQQQPVQAPAPAPIPAPAVAPAAQLFQQSTPLPFGSPLALAGSTTCSSTQEDAIDKALKLVVTSVHTSLPTAQMNISTPLSLTGQTHPLRQVTSTVSSMNSPIPSLRPFNEKRSVSQPSNRMTASSSHAIVSVQPSDITPTTIAAPSALVQSVSGTGQKNVILRVLPQQIGASQTGTVSVVLPQQVIPNALKGETNIANLVLQPKKQEVQIVQSKQVQAQKQPVQGRTRILSSPVRKPVAQNQLVRTVKTVYPSSLEKGLGGVTTQQGDIAGQIVQLNLAQTLLQSSSSPVSSTGTMVAQPLQSPPLVMSNASPQLASPVKVQPNIRIVSPQQMTLSSAGLVPVQMPASASQTVTLCTQAPKVISPPTASSSASKTVNMSSEPFASGTVDSLQGDSVNVQAKNSLDLLAVASMLHEANVPLDKAKATSETKPITLTTSQSRTVANQPQLILSPRKISAASSGAPIVSTLSTQQLVSSNVTDAVMTSPSAEPLKDVHHQQAKVLQQQLALQQQLLQEQQKQQKIFQQLAIQQQQQGVKGVTQNLQTVVQTKSSPGVSPIQTAGRILVTNAVRAPSASSTNITATTGGQQLATIAAKPSLPATSSTVQMAGIMASAGGRMVQLRFAVPQGMTVQQLLQTPQFQQQLVALKVSAIHGITTSTVPVTSTLNSLTSTQAGSQSTVLKTVASSATVRPVAAPQATSMTQVSLSSPIKLVPSANNPTQMQSFASMVSATTVTNATAAAIASPSVKNTIVTGSSGQQKEKVTLLLNVNGQLVQAQGLPVGARLAGQGSAATTSTKIVSAMSQPQATSKVVNLPNLSSLTGVRQVIQTSQAKPPATALLSALPQQAQPTRIITSPAKIQMQHTVPAGAANNQGLVLAPQQQVLLTRPAAGRNIIRVQAPSGVSGQRFQINVPASSMVNLSPKSNNIVATVAGVAPTGTVSLPIRGLPNGK